jgi:hypothetical protein
MFPGVNEKGPCEYPNAAMVYCEQANLFHKPFPDALVELRSLWRDVGQIESLRHCHVVSFEISRVGHMSTLKSACAVVCELGSFPERDIGVGLEILRPSRLTLHILPGQMIGHPFRNSEIVIVHYHVVMLH